MKLSYIWSKILKKLRLSALKNCEIHETSKAESGCNLVNVKMDRYSFCGYNCEMINVEIGSFVLLQMVWLLVEKCILSNGFLLLQFYEGRDSIDMKFSEHKRKKKGVKNNYWT